MEKYIRFSKWHLTEDCIVVNDTDLYILGQWNEDKWINCYQIDHFGKIIKTKIEIIPVMVQNMIIGVEIYA